MSRFKRTKTCPRCYEKCDLTDAKCPDCGLIFSRLELGSNKLAKKKILQGKKNEVVYNKGYPKDVRKFKVVLLCVFLGIFGAHCFYVGRIGRSIFMAIAGILTLACVTLTSFAFSEVLVSFSVIPSGIMGFMWIFDLVDVCINKFKIPISVDMGEGR